MEQKLGLCELPQPVRIYVGVSEGDESKSLWYRLETVAKDQFTRIPVIKPALHGYVRGIKVVEKTFKKETNLKLDVMIQADRTYIVRSGMETVFSRGLLLALIAVEDFSKPIYVCVRPGDDPKIVFCSVYSQNGDVVQHKWDGDVDLGGLINKLRHESFQCSETWESELERDKSGQSGQPKMTEREQVTDDLKQTYWELTGKGPRALEALFVKHFKLDVPPSEFVYSHLTIEATKQLIVRWRQEIEKKQVGE